MGDEFCLTFLVDTCVRGNSVIKAEAKSLDEIWGWKEGGGGQEKINSTHKSLLPLDLCMVFSYSW